MVKISLAAALLLAVCDAVSLTKFPDVDTLEDGLNKADTLEDGLTKAVENVTKIDWSVVQAFSDSVEDADQATKEDISDWLVSICEEHNIKEVHGEALVAFVGKQFGMEGIKDVTDLSAKLTTDYGVSQEEFNDTVKQCFAPRKEDHASEADADATEAEASEAEADATEAEADATDADAKHAHADHDDDSENDQALAQQVEEKVEEKVEEHVHDSDCEHDHDDADHDHVDTVAHADADRAHADADRAHADAVHADADHADADHASADDSEHDDDDDTATEEAAADATVEATILA